MPRASNCPPPNPPPLLPLFAHTPGIGLTPETLPLDAKKTIILVDGLAGRQHDSGSIVRPADEPHFSALLIRKHKHLAQEFQRIYFNSRSQNEILEGVAAASPALREVMMGYVPSLSGAGAQTLTIEKINRAICKKFFPQWYPHHAVLTTTGPAESFNGILDVPRNLHNPREMLEEITAQENNRLGRASRAAAAGVPDGGKANRLSKSVLGKLVNVSVRKTDCDTTVEVNAIEPGHRRTDLLRQFTGAAYRVCITRRTKGAASGATTVHLIGVTTKPDARTFCRVTCSCGRVHCEAFAAIMRGEGGAPPNAFPVDYMDSAHFGASLFALADCSQVQPCGVSEVQNAVDPSQKPAFKKLALNGTELTVHAAPITGSSHLSATNPAESKKNHSHSSGLKSLQRSNNNRASLELNGTNADLVEQARAKCRDLGAAVQTCRQCGQAGHNTSTHAKRSEGQHSAGELWAFLRAYVSETTRRFHDSAVVAADNAEIAADAASSVSAAVVSLVGHIERLLATLDGRGGGGSAKGGPSLQSALRGIIELLQQQHPQARGSKPECAGIVMFVCKNLNGGKDVPPIDADSELLAYLVEGKFEAWLKCVFKFFQLFGDLWARGRPIQCLLAWSPYISKKLRDTVNKMFAKEC